MFRILSQLILVSPPIESLCITNFGDRYDEAVDNLVERALIDNEDLSISVHRLMQTAFLHFMSTDDFQKAFDAVSELLNHAFPKQVKGRPLVPQWPTCKQLVLHVISLVRRFESFANIRKLSISSPFLE